MLFTTTENVFHITERRNATVSIRSTLFGTSQYKTGTQTILEDRSPVAVIYNIIAYRKKKAQMIPPDGLLCNKFQSPLKAVKSIRTQTAPNMCIYYSCPYDTVMYSVYITLSCAYDGIYYGLFVGQIASL